MRNKNGQFLPGHNGLTGRVGHLSNRWRGNNTSYSAKHCWIIKHYGNANKCENAECKFPNPKRYEWANISGKYLRDINDYKMLCPSCHRKMDKGNKCKKGHLYTPQNTIIRKQGWRACRACMKASSLKYRIKNKK